MDPFSVAPKMGPGTSMRFRYRTPNTLNYPSPFFDMASLFLPRTIKELLGWCRVYYMLDPLVNSTVHKMASYPIRQLIYDGDSEDLRKQWRTLFEDYLNIRTFQIEVGLDRSSYGNSFVSVSFPFHKWIKCKQCGESIRADDRKHEKDWRVVGFKFHLNCPKCGNNGEADAKDYYYKDWRGIKLLRWNPENINILYNQATGDKQIIYDLPMSVKSDITLGKKSIIGKMPQIYLQAMAEKKKIKLHKNTVFHLKRASVSHPTMLDDWEGWGMPMILPVLKDLFYLQILRKAQEALASEYIVPLRILFPQPNTATSDPYTAINLEEWKGFMEQELNQWRMDNNYIPIMPFPIGTVNFGGTGRALMLHQEIRVTAEHILAGMGVPQEFIFGGISYSGSNVSLRQIENEMLGHLQDMAGMLRFIVGRIAAHMGWQPIEIKHDKFKMGDDLQRSAFKFQLNQAGKISDRTLLEDSGLDVVEEEKRKKEEVKAQIESNKATQIAQAQIAGEAQLVQARYMGYAQFIQSQAMNAGPPPQTSMSLNVPQSTSRPMYVPTPEELDNMVRRQVQSDISKTMSQIKVDSAVRSVAADAQLPPEAQLQKVTEEWQARAANLAAQRSAVPDVAGAPSAPSVPVMSNSVGFMRPKLSQAMYAAGAAGAAVYKNIPPHQRNAQLQGLQRRDPAAYAREQQALQAADGQHTYSPIASAPSLQKPSRALHY